MPATTVLIVNEDAGLLARVKGELENGDNGFSVISAVSGPRALGLASAKQPDAIVVDCSMADVDGYALTKQMKGDPDIADIPVVLLSSGPTEVEAVRARQAGADARLPHDVEPQELARQLTGLIDTRSEAAPVAEESADAVSEASVEESPSGDAPPAADAPASSAPQEVPAPAAAAPAEAAPAEAASGAAKPAKPGYGAPEAPGPARSTGPDPSTTVEAGDGGEGGLDDLPSIEDMLRMLIERGGSDLHVTVGSAPAIRQRGELIPVDGVRPLRPRDTMELILNMLSEEQRRRFETELELDFAYAIPGVSRFRANVFQQRNSMAAVFRVVPLEIPTIDSLGLPRVCAYLAERPRGMVLITGPTGSGKSTTLAAMIDHINEMRKLHIITLEDPIEFLHQNKTAYVNQREVGEDTKSFAAALKRVLRQDPDVILVGEMRDLETISAAITAAETGHLVLATLHTTGGPETVDRIVDVFPPHQQHQVRLQLASTLEGVLSQVLLQSTDGRTRVMAMEIMLGIPAIRNLIREGKTHQMPTIIQGGAQQGMQTLDQHLKILVQSGKVPYEEAISKAQNPKELAALLGRRF